MSNEENISEQYPYESHYVEVNGSKLHYIDEGEGDPIVFIHGIPTWSYLWRNVIPHLSSDTRCIAIDLIGMGKSDKPDIEYTIQDHINYFSGFMDKLQLNHATFVMHGWGSVIGLHYAMQNQDKMKGIVCLESHLRAPSNRDMLALPVRELMSILDREDGGYDIVMNSNYYISKVLPSGVLRNLSATEMENYLMPFLEPGTNLPIWQYLQELPLGDNETAALKIIQTYTEQLEQSTLPKLLLYAVPGFITTIETVKWAKETLENISVVDIGEALHYAQESKPDIIGTEIKKWYESLG